MITVAIIVLVVMSLYSDKYANHVGFCMGVMLCRSYIALGLVVRNGPLI